MAFLNAVAANIPDSDRDWGIRHLAFKVNGMMLVDVLHTPFGDFKMAFQATVSHNSISLVEHVQFLTDLFNRMNETSTY